MRGCISAQYAYIQNHGYAYKKSFYYPCVDNKLKYNKITTSYL